jgi:hypothetical protein
VQWLCAASLAVSVVGGMSKKQNGETNRFVSRPNEQCQNGCRAVPRRTNPRVSKRMRAHRHTFDPAARMCFSQRSVWADTSKVKSITVAQLSHTPRRSLPLPLPLCALSLSCRLYHKSSFNCVWQPLARPDFCRSWTSGTRLGFGSMGLICPFYSPVE